MSETTINPEELFFGAPVSLTVDGFEAGGTLDAPKVSINPTVYTPEFQNALGPIEGTDVITKALVAVEFTVHEFTAMKIGWAMPGIEDDPAGTFEWDPGRIPSDAYHDVVMRGIGLDGRTMEVTIYKAISVQPVELEMGNQTLMGMKVRLEGRYNRATPRHVPFKIVLDPGS